MLLIGFGFCGGRFEGHVEHDSSIKPPTRNSFIIKFINKVPKKVSDLGSLREFSLIISSISAGIAALDVDRCFATARGSALVHTDHTYRLQNDSESAGWSTILREKGKKLKNPFSREKRGKLDYRRLAHATSTDHYKFVFSH